MKRPYLHIIEDEGDLFVRTIETRDEFHIGFTRHGLLRAAIWFLLGIAIGRVMSRLILEFVP